MTSKKREPAPFCARSLMAWENIMVFTWCSKSHDHLINAYNSATNQKEETIKFLFLKTKFINTGEMVALLATIQKLGFFDV